MLLAGCSANSATEPTEPSANSTSPSAEAAAETNSGSPAATATSATPTASPTPAEVTWAKHKFANENFQIELPSNWKIETIKPDQYQLVKDMTASFNIVSEMDATSQRYAPDTQKSLTSPYVRPLKKTHLSIRRRTLPTR